MALAVTLLGSATFDTASGTKTVVATPAVGDLIVIVTGHSGNTSAATPTDNNSSGAYTRINSSVKASSADTLGIHVRTALIPAASSTTFSHAPGASSGGGLAVFKVTGMQKVGAAAARASAKQDNIASGTPTPVLAQAALTTNALIAAVLNATNPAGLTPRGTPAWTERCDVGYNTPATGLETMSINSGETGTSIAWGGASPSAFCSLVLELDADQILTPGLFTNSPVFSAPTVAATYGLTPGIVTNSASFYAPTVAAAAQALTPSLFTNSAAFFAPTVAAGPVALTPSLFNDADTFPAATVSATYGLAPTLVADADTFHNVTVAPGAVALLPSLVSDADTFHAATVGRGSVNLAPSLVAASNSFHAPTLGGSYALTPALYADADSFHAAAVAALNAILPSLVVDGDTFHAATVGAGSVGLSAPLFANSPTFHAASVGRGVVGLTPSLVASGAAFHGPIVTVDGGPVTLLPGLFANDNAFPVATVSSVADLLPSLLASSAIFPASSLASQYPMLPALLTNESVFHGPTVETGTADVSPALVTNDNCFHSAEVAASSDVELLAASFENVAVFPAPWLRSVFGGYPLAGRPNRRPLAGRSRSYPLRRSA